MSVCVWDHSWPLSVPAERRVNGEGWWWPRHIRHQQTDTKQTDLAFFPHQVRLEDPSTAHTPEPDAEELCSSLQKLCLRLYDSGRMWSSLFSVDPSATTGLGNTGCTFMMGQASISCSPRSFQSSSTETLTCRTLKTLLIPALPVEQKVGCNCSTRARVRLCVCGGVDVPSVTFLVCFCILLEEWLY